MPWKALYARSIDKEMNMKYKVNRRIFNQYLAEEVREHGSERRVAMRTRLSHTLIQSLRKGFETTKDGRRIPKTQVNLATARKIEAAWGIPREVCFLPDVLDARSITAA